MNEFLGKNLDIYEFHRIFREKNALKPFIISEILQNYAFKSAKWLSKRKAYEFWNFDQVYYNLTTEYGFEEVDFNLAVGDHDWQIMHHIMSDPGKRQKIYGFYTHIGVGFCEIGYKYWCILYARESNA